MERKDPSWLKLTLRSGLLFWTVFPVHLLWGWLLSLLFWPPTMKQESKFFFEDKDAFYKTMNIYFSWGGSHSPFLVYRQPLEQFLISETLFPFTWTHLKTLQSSECSHCWLSQTWSQRIIVLCGEERKELLVKEKSIHHLHSKNGTAAGEGTLSLTAYLSFSPGWTQTALGVKCQQRAFWKIGLMSSVSWLSESRLRDSWFLFLGT